MRNQSAWMRLVKFSASNSFSFLALTLAFCPTQLAQAGFFNHSFDNRFESKNVFHLNPIVSYYKSSGNYDANGNSREIGGGFNAYTRFQVDINATYGLFQDFAIFGRLSWALSHLDHTSLTGDNYGLSDQTAGLTYRVKKPNPNSMGLSGMSIDLQTQIDFPAYSNSSARTAKTPYLGDGTLDWTTGAFLSLPVARHGTYSYWLTTGAGYTYRTQDYSAHLPWSFQMQMVPEQKGFLAGIGFNGFQSLKTDAFAKLTPPSRGTNGAGGNFYVNAMNPSQAQGQILLGTRLNPKNSIYLGATSSIYGQAAPKSFTLFLGFQARFGDPKAPLTPLSEEEYGRSNKGFVTYGIEAKVTKTNEKLNLIKLDRGSADGIKKGQIFDIFESKSDGSGSTAVCRAKVISITTSEAALSITEFYKEVWIEEGFIAKQPIQ